MAKKEEIPIPLRVYKRDSIKRSEKIINDCFYHLKNIHACEELGAFDKPFSLLEYIIGKRYGSVRAYKEFLAIRILCEEYKIKQMKKNSPV